MFFINLFKISFNKKNIYTNNNFYKNLKCKLYATNSIHDISKNFPETRGSLVRLKNELGFIQLQRYYINAEHKKLLTLN